MILGYYVYYNRKTAGRETQLSSPVTLTPNVLQMH